MTENTTDVKPVTTPPVVDPVPVTSSTVVPPVTTESTPAVSPVNTPPSPPTKSKKKMFLIIGAFVAFFLILAIAVAAYNMVMPSTPAPVATPVVVTQTPEPTPQDVIEIPALESSPTATSSSTPIPYGDDGIDLNEM